MRKTILIAFDDPGGGLVVSSLLEKLCERRDIVLEIYSGKLSERFLEEKKIRHHSINSNIEKRDAENIFKKITPDILVTATGGGNAEQTLRNEAHDKNIPSIVLLDFWKDYSRRWLYASYEIKNMKDKILVMDELTKNEMIEEGFPGENIFVTGHTYIDKIFNEESETGNDEQAVVKKILFLSQPLKIIRIENYEVHPLQALMEALRKYSAEKKTKIILTVKLHPSELNTKEMNDIINNFKSDELIAEIADNKKLLKDIIKDSDLVVGYNTIAMFEARSLNKRTISLNAAPVKKSLVAAMENAGIEIVDTGNIFEALMKECKNVSAGNIYKGAIDNCVNIILQELNLN